MKFDKDTLIEQRFWVLMAIFFPLVLIAIFGYWIGAAGAIDEVRTKIEKSQKDLAGTKNPKNHITMQELNKQDVLVGIQREKVWKTAWDRQKDLVAWPADFRQLDDTYWGSEIAPLLRTEYIDEKSGYRAYFKATAKLADPIPLQGGPDKVLNRQIHVWPHKPPSSEELWLTLEDVCLYREMLRTIRDANNLVGSLKKVPGAAKKDEDKGEIDRQLFRNQYWELDLVLTRPEAGGDNRYTVSGQIKNVSKRQLTLGVTFQVWLHKDADPVLVAIEGEPPFPGVGVTFKPVSVDLTVAPTGLVQVVQAYDRRNTPIKRIDRIELGYLAHRNAAVELKTAPFSPLPEVKASSDPMGMGGTGGAGTRDPMGMGPAGAGAAGALRNASPNGVERSRYSFVSEQVRRVPIAVVVEVDQAHMQEVLAAFARSKLNLQVVQVDWARIPGGFKPEPEGSDTSGTSPSTGGPPYRPREGIGPTRPPMGPPMGITPSFSPRTGGGDGMFGDPYNFLNDEPETSVVEMAGSAVASIYSRYPPKPQASQ